MLKYLSKISLAVILLAFLFIGNFFASADDGFGPARKIESQHFTIYYAPQLDPDELARELDIRPLDSLISGGSYKNDLGGMIDTLFSQVCDILDMEVYSFHGTIKICRDFNQVSGIYKNLFDRELTNSHSYYVSELNTVYVSAEHFKREILGHEIAHGVETCYFAVSPSVKVQEVLAGFVEYQLRKSYK